MLLLFRKLFLISLLFWAHCGFAQAPSAQGRERYSMDANWRFALGHPFDTKQDFGNGTSYFSYFAKTGYGDGAASPLFDDRAWRQLDLPHDWAVELPFDSTAQASHGYKAIGRNFPATSVGWYRKTFTISAADLGRQLSLEFDGVYRNSKVWVNGHYLGTEPSGYSSFRYNITDYLNYGGTNVVAVRVDATMPEGWYYEGAGIYRHVWLTKTSPVHVAPNGTWVTTRVAATAASVTARASLLNEGKQAQTCAVTQTVLDAQGRVVGSQKQDAVALLPFQQREISLTLPVADAKLWDLESPYLYTLRTTVLVGNQEVDRYDTPFGIRTIRFDANEGFFLNGKPVKLKGTNNHQDHAGVGTALPDELHYFRIKALKAMGSNAYRCSHHPPTPELLAACDQLGMLVIDENRLMGTNYQMQEELRDMIVRDRNHPSIISWSIGNEEWGIENSATGARIAATMQAYVHSLDSTRLCTAGVSGGFRSGISDVVEVMGYNYLGNGDIDAHHRQFPNQPGMGTEEGSTFATRGVYVTDPQQHYQAAYDQKPRPSFYSIEEGWRFYAERPYLAGMFIWTGFDYRGESTPYQWPSVTSYFGMMDLCGFLKDNVYYLRSWWSQQPTLHLLPHWNWPGREGQPVEVWAYTNCDEVELFLNKKSLGKQAVPLNSHVVWKVNYAPGTLEARGYKSGRQTLTEAVKTTSQAAAIQLNPHKATLEADGEDLAVVTVAVADRRNLTVPTAAEEITFSVTGPARIIGVGNGNPTSLEKEKFVEAIQMVAVQGLQEAPVAGLAEGVAARKQKQAAAWQPAFVQRDYKKLAPAYRHQGTFQLPANFANARVTFFYNSIGQEQHLYINGQEIAKDLKYSAEGNVFLLTPALLKPGQNTLEIVATPLTKEHDWDVVNTNPGTIQVFTPATPWKRKTFNGLAQVLLQTTKEPGTITLTATSKGLKTATLKLKAEKAAARPAVL